jgi:anti-sigma B factor antagonist/stage II sporulation protein AA (anti-sigma F factor antagonist)
MNLNVTRHGNSVVLAPVGRIDHASAEAFGAALQPHLEACRDGAGSIVLDMSGVDYVSSVGLRVLMMASRQVKGRKGHIVVAALAPLVREVFEISRFNLVFDLFDDVGAALGAVGERG